MGELEKRDDRSHRYVERIEDESLETDEAKVTLEALFSKERDGSIFLNIS